ncbi:DUF4905 domain-containing protein [Ekhidna sp.]|uniref:DUF4905 domain-containing protein n=1 Tax=Ekhidna sp. TaxID=2608089 RepID=UPI0032EDD45B
MIPKSIKHVQLSGQIWSTAIDYGVNQLYLDVRDREKNSIEFVQLDLSSLKALTKAIDISWWSQLFSVSKGALYFIEYEDQSDPASKNHFVIDWKTEKRKKIEQVPKDKEHIKYPEIYEHGTEYHRTVADFLSLELPLSCEYLEWNDKIIISYYLRSGKVFERFLLLLKDGAKEWKITQDESMKGFSPGAFFVFKNQLIFIKDQNEVCVYTG